MRLAFKNNHLFLKIARKIMFKQFKENIEHLPKSPEHVKAHNIKPNERTQQEDVHDVS